MSDATGVRYQQIASFYDALYQANDNVWQVVGRTSELRRYIASLVESLTPNRYLDVCCGDGSLLAMVSAPEKFGIDISARALDSATERTGVAHLCQGCVEQLPYHDELFDVITNVGGMEHFLDDAAATREAYRVLRPGGRYVVLLLRDRMWAERVRIKISEFIYPRARPLALARWAWSRWTGHAYCRPVETLDTVPIQPVQNRYSPGSAKALFTRTGFKLNRLITKRLVPDAPLGNHYFGLYVLAKTPR